MIINGMQKVTLLDYPNNIACMIFTSGCNFKCPYCHNSSLIKQNKEGLISEKEVFDYLKKRKNILDGLVISGGEPTVQKDLIEFINKVKRLGYKIKLDTNGYKPDVLKEIIDNNLVDYIAMDIKNTFSKYNQIINIKNPKVELLKESIELIKNSNIDHEFRTTIIKEHHTLEDINEIIKIIGKSKYYIQNFRLSEDVINQSLNSFSDKELDDLKDKLKQYPNVNIRG